MYKCCLKCWQWTWSGLIICHSGCIEWGIVVGHHPLHKEIPFHRDLTLSFCACFRLQFTEIAELRAWHSVQQSYTVLAPWSCCCTMIVGSTKCKSVQSLWMDWGLLEVMSQKTRSTPNLPTQPMLILWLWKVLVFVSTFDNQNMSIGCVGKLGGQSYSSFLRHYLLNIRPNHLFWPFQRLHTGPRLWFAFGIS